MSSYVIEHSAEARTDVDHLVTTDEAARRLSVSVGYLKNLRVSGGGPVYRQLGRAVRYRIGDLSAWADTKSRNSTSQVAA
jgi:hypothetical protein